MTQPAAPAEPPGDEGSGPRDADSELGASDVAAVALLTPVAVVASLARCVPAGAAEVTDVKSRLQHQLTVARTIGQMTTNMLEKKLRSRWSVPPRPEPASDEPDPTRPSAGTDDAATAAPTHESAHPEPAPRAPDEVPTNPAVPDAVDLPLDDYESLAASHVVRRLAALGPDELALIERFERAHRQRRTILGKIDQLRAT